MILYLHGFRSSPNSFKAREVERRLTELGRAHELVCPQLPASPKAAMALALALACIHAAECSGMAEIEREISIGMVREQVVDRLLREAHGLPPLQP